MFHGHFSMVFFYGLQYQYNINQINDENKEAYQFGDD